MDFKQQVMRDAEAKYREMANGTAGKPLSRTPVLNSDEAYAEKRSSYCNRLIHERDSFNDAVKRTRQANKSRLEDERRQQLARAEKREAHREWRKKFFRSLIKLAVVFGALGAFAYFVVWQKWVFPNMSVKDLYTPEILQTYCRSNGDNDAIITFTSCSDSGQVTATWEVFSDKGNVKVNLTGKITEKKNSGQLEIIWTSNEVVYISSSMQWEQESSATVKDHFGTLVTDNATFSAGVNDEYSISTADDLKKLTNSKKTYYLKNDIDLSGINWTPIQGFSGVLIGNGHTIKNLKIVSDSSGRSDIGFFSVLDGIVLNLNFEGALVKSEGRNENIGVLCGTLKNKISDINISGVIEAPRSTHVGGLAGTVLLSDNFIFENLINEVNVTALTYAGGLFGYVEHHISNGITAYSLKLMNSTNKTSVTAVEDYAGGFIGYYTADATGIGGSVDIIVSDCQNFGSINGRYYVGGIIGCGDGERWGCGRSNIIDCANQSEITGKAYIGCVAGKLKFISMTSCKNTGSRIHADGYTVEDSVKYAYVGGFAGYGFNASSCSNEVSIEYSAGGRYVGGVMGCASGFGLGDSMTSRYMSNVADIKGCDYVGGVIGAVQADMDDWYYTNTFSYYDCNNKGTVVGTGDYVGGIFGNFYVNCDGGNSWVYICDAVNEGNVSGASYVGGIAGKADKSTCSSVTGEMKSSSYINGKNSGTIIGVSNYGDLIGESSIPIN